MTPDRTSESLLYEAMQNTNWKQPSFIWLWNLQARVIDTDCGGEQAANDAGN